VQIMVAHKNAKEGNPELAYESIMDLSQTHGIETRVSRSESLDNAADELFTNAALYSTMRIVDKVEEFAKANEKKVLYVLSHGASKVAKRLEEGTRFDQPFVDFLVDRKLPFIDLMDSHLADYEHFKISVKDYLDRYYIGHYNPAGNLFTAFAIKDKLVEMLEPKPAAYQPPDWTP